MEARVRKFGQDLQDMLNQTVCDNAKIMATGRPDGNVFLVGTALVKNELRSQPVRLRSTAQRNKLWLDVSFNVGLEEEEDLFLVVLNSTWTVSVGVDEQVELLHYDYERNKQTYTEAHLQVSGAHAEFESYLEQLGRPKDGLSKLHLPLGGRRFRPCLEDIIEFLIVEKLVIPRDDNTWQAVLNYHRRGFRRKQIAALVRRNLDDVIGELRRLKYAVDPPSDGPAASKLERLRRSSQAKGMTTVNVVSSPGKKV